MNSLVFLHFSKSTLKTLKCILNRSENIIPGTKFLLLNKFVKYRNRDVFIFMKNFLKLEIMIFIKQKKQTMNYFRMMKQK